MKAGTYAGTSAALSTSVTAQKIEEVLHNTPVTERIATAARLIALALVEDELDEPDERLPEDRDGLIAHLHDKRAR